MTSGCISSARCIDARVPVRATYVNLYRWPESDAAFVKSVGRGGDERAYRPRKWGPEVVDSYSCRQLYLRSYKFSRKESVPEKTRRCLGKVRGGFPFSQRRSVDHGLGKLTQRATDFPERRRSEHRGPERREAWAADSPFSQRRSKNDGGGQRSSQRRKKNGSCGTSVRKLREISCKALSSIFHRFLSCTTSVEVV